jgi:hypothetical protein
MEEVAVGTGYKVLVEVDYNISPIFGNPKGTLDQ